MNSDIIFILDASSSMYKMGKEPVDSLNQFIREQKINDGSTFTLVLFNTKMKILLDEKSLSTCEYIYYDNYVPSGMTALYDAIGTMIENKLESKRNRDVIMVILTDGEENSSQRYTKDKIQRLTKKAKSIYNWQFVYLGANQDAFEVGTSLGCNISTGYEYNPNGMKTTISKCCTAIKTSKLTGEKIKNFKTC